MKVTDIANKILPYLVKNAVENENFSTELDDLQKLIPGESRHKLELAVDMLRHDDLVTAFDYDDEPHEIEANIAGIRSIEENTLVKKGYNFLKELRQWI